MLGNRIAKRTWNIPAIPFSDCPAKTYDDNKEVRLGRSVVDHCHIVGEVARELVERYPEELKKALFPARAPFAAACHDIGKVSPCFVEKLRRACTVVTDRVPPLPVNPNLEREWGGHAGVSQVAAQALGAPQWVPEVLGQHHGFSPSVAGKRADAEVFGGESWQKERESLVRELKRRLGMDWPELTSVHQARLVAGLTSVADWIGSGKHFENPDEPWDSKIEEALDEAGFVRPAYRAGLSFEDIFGFVPRRVQTRLIESVTGPGVYVLEAPMGLGKTEAALFAAYRLLASEEAVGIYFALPTQLTSNKVYQRFNAFLARILSDESKHRSLLLHANAWLIDTEMGEEGRPGGAWFNQAKRGLLAPFAVGTVDQALMAAMHVKHGFVRAFGLAGKVVILDEVHTYDAYTSTLLNALVRLLRNLHCTVIVLSATLNHERRSELVDAQLRCDAYPLITAVSNEQPPRELPVPAKSTAQIAIKLHGIDLSCVQEALDRASQGQQVLWIENTVRDAQERYLDLAARATEMGVKCGLLHSRFSMVDRARIEHRWVDLFAKAGWAHRQKVGRILVGTQVLEQSLDIDADFLISRFAPTDMLLQRLGRLWRHVQTPRPAAALCEAWLLAPVLSRAIEEPYAAFGASASVYSPYVLCRSLEVWHGVMTLSLPDDIRDLIERTYAARPEQGSMARWLHELDHGNTYRHGRLALQQLARVGLAESGKTLPESKAQTRYSESDSFDVLLLRDLQHIRGERAARLVLLDGRELVLPASRSKRSKRQWKELTATLMQQLVPVRSSEAPQPVSRDTLEKYYLHHCFYLGDPNWIDDESLLRVALVDETGTLRGLHGSRAHEKHQLEYRDDLGYRILRT